MSSLFVKIHFTFFRATDSSDFRIFSNVVISEHHALYIDNTKF